MIFTGPVNHPRSRKMYETICSLGSDDSFRYGFFEFHILSRCHVESTLAKKNTKKTSILKVEANYQMAVSGFFKRILFLKAFGCKAMLGIGGGACVKNNSKYVNFYINWWLGICMLVAPHVDQILCYHFFLWIQIFRGYKFVTSGKYMGVTLAEIWNLQENFDYLPHVSCLNFCFKKSTYLLHMFRPVRFFWGVMSFGWPKKKLRKKRIKAIVSKALVRFLTIPCILLLSPNLTPDDPIPEEPKEHKVSKESNYNMSCVCKVVGCWRFVEW